MAGVPELLAGAILKQVAVRLGSAIWKEIGEQMSLSEDLKDLETTFAAVQNVLRKAEKRSDGEKTVWIEELKDAAYDMEDMLMDFEHQISSGSNVSELGTARVSIPMNMRWTMRGKMKDMKERLKKIAKLKELDSMTGISSGDQEGIHKAEGPLPGEDIVGRTSEREAIMRLLQQECKHSIIPIYGFGGFGKTTLARMVFEDCKITGGFDNLVWVHVTDKFNLEKIGRSIISQVEDGPSTQYDYAAVQQRVGNILRDKQSLVVLDDIWEDKENNLEELRVLLGVAKNSRNKEIGPKRTKVILTTRNERIAKLMNEQFQFKLDVLPYVDCWELFKAKAFPPSRNVESRVEKEKVGRAIVQKCKGFPLAVKSIGWRLRDAELKTWEVTLECDPWLKETSPTGDTASTAVLDSLKHSYCNMPEYLRPCFAYFSVFPKGFVVHKKDLLQQWIALGFVANEYVADQYLSKLTDMSFLQIVSAAPSIPARYSKHRSEVYQMHDFVHALATFVAGEEVAMFFARQGGKFSSKRARQGGKISSRRAKCRYILFSNIVDMALKCSNMPSKARAMHFKDCKGLELQRGTFSNAKWLRVLDFSGMGRTIELPDSMIHLQVLNLSENTGITKLPSRISNFKKLHYLDLHGCSNLRELPDSIGKLKELLNLDLSKCASLKELPMSLGELQNLSSLNVSFCYQLKTVPETFSELTNLEELNMSSCSFNQLPTSLFKMDNLSFLDLSSCTELVELHGSSEGLSALQYLNLSDCSKLQNILGLLTFTAFVSLKYLNLSGVGGSGGTEAPGTSVGGVSNDFGHGLQLRELHGVLKCLRNLEYLVVGGLTLFSEQGIGGIDELITLPDFVVRQRDARCSNITLLQSIIDLTHHNLNIRCLENIGSPEEASAVGLENKKHLHSLSLEWSLSEYDDADKDNDKVVLQNLRPNRNLKNLSVKGYKPYSFPEWITKIHQTLPNLVKIVLSDISNCTSLPPLRYLPKLEAIEICRMPMLRVVYIGQCKNLRKLSLVELPHGATVRLDDDTRGVEVLSEVHESGRAHYYHLEAEEETEYHPISSEPSIDNNPNKKQVNIVAKAIGLLKNVFRVQRRERDHAVLMSEMPQTSLSHLHGLSQEAKAGFTMQLNCMCIGACRDLKFYPRIPQIPPILFHNVGPFPFIGGVNRLNTMELVIDNCSGFPDFSDFYWDNLQILRIINCFKFDFTPERIPTFSSLRELEIGFSIEVKDVQSLLLKTTKLEKLILISEYVDALEVEVPWVITKEVSRFRARRPIKHGSVSSCSSNLSLLYQYLDYEIMHLIVENLEQVERAEEVINERRELAQYLQLQSLSLMWSRSSSTHDSSIVNDTAVLQNLQPPRNLKKLRIQGYWGVTFCSWMLNISYFLPNLVSVELSDVMNCDHIPSLGQLANMEVLHISDMPRIRKVSRDIYGGGRPFRKLRELTIEKMFDLEWITTLAADDDQQLQKSREDEIFPSLQVLAIINCHRLRFVPAFPASRRCNIERSSHVLSSEQYIGSSELTSSWSMEIKNCSFSPDDFKFLKNTDNLEELSFHSCMELMTLPDTIRSSHSLRKLEVVDCQNFSSLPAWLGELTSLQEVKVQDGNLKLLSQSNPYLTSLDTLVLVLNKCNFRRYIIHTTKRPVLSFRRRSSNTVELHIKDLELVDKDDNCKYKELCLKYNNSKSHFGCWMSSLTNLVKLELSHVEIKSLKLMPSLTNLVKLELSSVHIEHLHLDQAQSLEELHISWIEGWRQVCTVRISCTGPLRKLKRIVMSELKNVELQISMEVEGQGSDENLFPGLQDLELCCCSKLRFEPSIPRSARYILSGSERQRGQDLCPSFHRIMGPSIPTSLSKMEIRFSTGFSSASWDSLRHFEIGELIIMDSSDEIPLPESIRGWTSLQKLEILNCENITTLPKWLGEITSLQALKVDANYMVALPACIQKLTSLKTLTLSKCGMILEKRCNSGEDKEKLEKLRGVDLRIEPKNMVKQRLIHSETTPLPSLESTNAWTFESDSEQYTSDHEEDQYFFDEQYQQEYFEQDGNELAEYPEDY